MTPFTTYRPFPKPVLDAFETMKDCPQSPIHHGEGNVARHTQMVFDEVKKLSEPLSSEALDRLLITSCFHDLAKPFTTHYDEFVGDWVSPGHAKAGEPLFRQLMWSEYPFGIREEIAALIRWHGLPIWTEEKQDPDMAVIAASLRCNLRELSLFAEADFRGRICQDLEASLFKIELFKERAEKLGCLETPYEFTSPWARLHYFKNGEYPGKVIHEPSGSEVVLMCGVSGSGKNKWIHSNYDGRHVIELDEIRKRLRIKPTDRDAQGTIAQAAKEELRVCLRKGENVLWNATNLTKQQRASIIDLALQYRAKIRIVYIECSLEKAIRQNVSRPEEKQIPTKAIEKMFGKLEMPDLTECHQLEIIQ